MAVIAEPIPMLSDNYSWLLTESESGKIAIVDPAEAAPAITAIEAAGGKLDYIFLTHHHGDHINGVAELIARYQPIVVGNGADAARLPKLDIAVHEGSLVDFGAAKLRVIDTPGHTLGHISFYIADGGVLLPGDTLFSLGCGRLMEGTPSDMFRSLRKFDDLPGETLVCAGHEYSASNAKFALSVDPDNEALQARSVQITKLREAGQSTLPTTLASEREANPFLRAPDEARLGQIRAAKDIF